MKNKPTTILKMLLTTAAMVATACLSSRADTVTDAFTGGVDFTTNGVTGTIWDGVYLGFGDVPNGNSGPDGNGVTLAAEENSISGFLHVQTQSSSWGGVSDDGFFLYKNVTGDFDMSVQVAGAPYQNANYHFAGLLVRATAFPTGGAFNPTGTNASENWVNMTRYNEFNVNDQVRYATNGADVQLGFGPPSNTDTNTSRYLRIQRVGNVFNFYDKTNAGDAWILETNLTRPEFSGVPLQVGIEDADFTANTPSAYFTSFSLTSTNTISNPTPPADPTGLTIGPGVTTNDLKFSWTPAAGSAGSLLVVRANNSLITAHQPGVGFTYTSGDTFSPTNGFGDANMAVIYVGSGSSVTVPGFGGSNNTYYAAVYSYSNSGAATVYGVHPATAQALGPGHVSAVNFTLVPTSIAVGGAAVASVTATYTSGDSYDVSSATTTIWASSSPSVAYATNGTVSGLAVGSAIITATYAGIPGTNTVTVHGPAFTDNFSAAQDYLASGVDGSGWTGLFARDGDFSGETKGGSGLNTMALDANITSNNVLTITAAGSYWEGASDNGPFLWKRVPGDFQASVHINNYTHPAYQFVGLMARAFAANNVSPGGTGGTETHVNWWRFDQFGVTSSARITRNNALTVHDSVDGDTTDYWLLMARVNATNFYFFKKANQGDPWTFVPSATIVSTDLVSSVPMEVGLAQAVYTPNTGTVQFDSFMLDASGITSPDGVQAPPAATNFTGVFNPDLSMTFSWVAVSNGVAMPSILVMRAGAPVNVQPYFTDGGLTPSTVFGAGVDLGGGNFVMYRQLAPAPSSNNTVTVTGLTPGQTYYASVYTFSPNGSGDRMYSTSPSVTTSLQDGVIQGLAASISSQIPMGGIGVPKALGTFPGPTLVDVTSATTFTSADPTIITSTNGVLTGVGLGTTTITASLAGFTNTFSATVRNPRISDNFSVNHDYLNNGVAGSIWDGVYLGDAVNFPSNSVFNGNNAGDDGYTTDADANVTTNGFLTVTHSQTDWAGAGDDGFFLFKTVDGDFQVAVQIASLTKVNYQFAGLMARMYSTNGEPSVIGTNAPAENWAYFGEFDEFNDDVEARRARNGADTEFPGVAGTNDWWLLMKRSQGTNFSFFKRLTATNAWIPLVGDSFVNTNMVSSAPVQVGLFAAIYTSNVGTVQYGNFMLDPTVGPSLSIATDGLGNVVLTWPTDDGVTLQSTTSLNPTSWSNVGVTPTTTSDGHSTVTLPISGSAKYFRLSQ